MKGIVARCRRLFASPRIEAMFLYAVGLEIIASRRIWQLRDFGPPVVGPLALAGGAFMVVYATWLLVVDYRASRKRSPIRSEPDWSAVRVFGEPTPGAAPVRRPSAYGILTDSRAHVAVVSTPKGTYLPGGGVDAGETTLEAIVRETAEECGLAVRLSEWTCYAVEIVSASPEKTYFEKRSTFVAGETVGRTDNEVEPEHDCRWVTAAEAIEVLTPASHRWAVGEWRRRRAPSDR